MKFLKLLFGRNRVERPRKTFSVPVALAIHYRNMAWLASFFAIVFFCGWIWEHNGRMSDANKPPPVVTAVVTPDFKLIKVMSEQDMEPSDWVNVARAAAADFVVRMRNVERPIDFTIRALDDAKYHLLAGQPAVMKFNAFIGSKPYDEISKLNGKRSVMVEKVYAELKPGTPASGDPLLISVSWPETIEANGVYSKVTVQRQGEVLISRVKNVPSDFVKHNPLGAFVMDFEGDLSLRSSRDDFQGY